MAPNDVGYRPRLVLASASPRRRELLRSAGVDPDVEGADIDETPLLREPPCELVVRLAQRKAEAVLARCGERERGRRIVVIAADTVVTVDDEIFGKPTSDAEARTMLSRLSGRCHTVVTGVAVSVADRCEVAQESTMVWFRPLDAADIDCYVASGEPRGKAGAYAIQGRGALFVERIEGSYHCVVGLPLHVVDRLCASVGWPLSTWVGAPA